MRRLNYNPGGRSLLESDSKVSSAAFWSASAVRGPFCFVGSCVELCAFRLLAFFGF